MEELLSCARGGGTIILSGYLQERPQLVNDVGNGAKGEQMTLLMAAASGGQRHVVALCLANGASPNAVNVVGKSGQHFAAAGGHAHVVTFLLQHGADPTLRTLDSPNNRQGNMTALMFVAQCRGPDKKCHETIQVLLRACPNINDRGPGGASALWLACSKGRTKIAKALLMLGANPWLCDSRGTTPVQAAEESGVGKCAKLLQNQTLKRREEMRRAYLVSRARCIRDAFTTRLALADAPLPPYLATRAMGVKELPIVELKSKYRGGWKRKGGRGDVLREADTRLMVTVDYVTRGLDNSLFLELMMYF